MTACRTWQLGCGGAIKPARQRLESVTDSASQLGLHCWLSEAFFHTYSGNGTRRQPMDSKCVELMMLANNPSVGVAYTAHSQTQQQVMRLSCRRASSINT